MKNKLVPIVLTLSIVSAIVVLNVFAGPRERTLKPGAANFTIKPVFSNTAEAVNVVTTVPATVIFVWDGATNGTATTTLEDLQATDTVNQKADGTFPVITVYVQ